MHTISYKFLFLFFITRKEKTCFIRYHNKSYQQTLFIIFIIMKDDKRKSRSKQNNEIIIILPLKIIFFFYHLHFYPIFSSRSAYGSNEDEPIDQRKDVLVSFKA